jgi:hypothetical protein
LHSRQVNVCRSRWSAWSDTGERRARKVRLPQFLQSGLSRAPKRSAFCASFLMTRSPDPVCKPHTMIEMCL